MPTLFLAAWTLACSADAPALPPEAERGRVVYAANCTSCHNADPAKPGSLGPEVKGASRELLEARVVRAEYPVGYAAKRPSTMMRPLPKLAGEIDALAAYLR